MAPFLYVANPVGLESIKKKATYPLGWAAFLITVVTIAAKTLAK